MSFAHPNILKNKIIHDFHYFHGVYMNRIRKMNRKRGIPRKNCRAGFRLTMALNNLQKLLLSSKMPGLPFGRVQFSGMRVFFRIGILHGFAITHLRDFSPFPKRVMRKGSCNLFLRSFCNLTIAQFSQFSYLLNSSLYCTDFDILKMLTSHRRGIWRAVGCVPCGIDPFRFRGKQINVYIVLRKNSKFFQKIEHPLPQISKIYQPYLRPRATKSRKLWV